MPLRIPFPTFLSFLCACLLCAGPLRASSVAAQAEELMRRTVAQDGPGVVALIANGDALVFRGARGLAQIELGVALSADQVFRIASVTKMFTAATVLRLAELGELSLDDALVKYLPDFPNAGGIRLHQLLDHTSGVSDVVRDVQPGFSRRDVDTATLLAEIRKRPPDFSPGSRWAYSNAGYMLLGAVIEKITGEPWHVVMQRTLFDPLALGRTRYGSHADLIAGRVAGYTTDPQTRQVRNAAFIHSSVPAAAGALVSSADDLWHWMRALFKGRVIGSDGLGRMIAAGPDLPGTSTAYRYGLGMYLWRVRGDTMVGHTGQIPGFASFVGYLPKQETTIVVLANDDGFDARTFGKRLAAIALGSPFPEPTGIPVPDAMLRALEGTYRSDDGTIETLSVREHELLARRGEGKTIPLRMSADRRLHFVPDELSYFSPVADAHGTVVRLDYFEGGEGPPMPMRRIPAH